MRKYLFSTFNEIGKQAGNNSPSRLVRYKCPRMHKFGIVGVLQIVHCFAGQSFAGGIELFPVTPANCAPNLPAFFLNINHDIGRATQKIQVFSPPDEGFVLAHSANEVYAAQPILSPQSKPVDQKTTNQYPNMPERAEKMAVLFNGILFL